jgi:AAA-like domain
MISTEHGSPRAIGLNFLAGGDGENVWSVYVLQPPGRDRRTLPADECSALAPELLEHDLEADFCLLRVARPWTIDDYAIGVEAAVDVRNPRRAALRRHVKARGEAIQALDVYTIDEFLAIRLAERPDSLHGSGRAWVIDAESAVFASVLRCVRARRARRIELARLVRFSRRDSTSNEVRTCLQIEAPAAAMGMADVGVESLFNNLHELDFPVDAALTAELRRRQPLRWAARLSLRVGAADEIELAQRVSALRGRLGTSRLRESIDDQSSVLGRHLRAGDGDADVDPAGIGLARLGSLRLITAGLGSRGGAFVGHTVTGIRRPVLFDPFEAWSRGAAPGTLITGASGTGKTRYMQLVMHNAFITGASIVDVDLAGDHTLDRLPELAGHVEVLELSAVKRFRGLLDPLRIGPPDLRERLACDFLLGLLPRPIPVGWYAEIVEAVRNVVRGHGTSCMDVVAQLGKGSSAGCAAARAIEARVAHGLPALGYGRSSDEPPDDSHAQVTCLRLRDLASAPSGASVWRGDRLVRTIVSLLTAYALHLACKNHKGRCLIGLDDARPLLADPSGRAVVDELVERARSGQLAPVLATRKMPDPDWLEGRCGAAFCFRGQAADAPRGRCHMRDFAGRVGSLQVAVDSAI